MVRLQQVVPEALAIAAGVVGGVIGRILVAGLALDVGCLGTRVALILVVLSDFERRQVLVGNRLLQK